MSKKEKLWPDAWDPSLAESSPYGKLQYEQAQTSIRTMRLEENSEMKLKMEVKRVEKKLEGTNTCRVGRVLPRLEKRILADIALS